MLYVEASSSSEETNSEYIGIYRNNFDSIKSDNHYLHALQKVKTL